MPPVGAGAALLGRSDPAVAAGSARAARVSRSSGSANESAKSAAEGRAVGSRRRAETMRGRWGARSATRGGASPRLPASTRLLSSKSLRPRVASARQTASPYTSRAGRAAPGTTASGAA
ncbi:MAG: hypothetical protein R3B70_01240 [Polyangiaceae bacterium]